MTSRLVCLLACAAAPLGGQQYAISTYAGGAALDAGGNLYVTDWGNRRIRKISSSGIVTTIAGSGAGGYPSDASGPALDAPIGPPTAVTVDTAGNVFFADGYMIRVLRPLTGASN